jgi:hypothetical protein
MKRVVLFALVLTVCGVLHNSALAADRYLVTYWRSLTGPEIRSTTVVTVVNQSSSVCNVQVEWFPSAASATPVGTSGPLVVDPTEAVQFCSRNLRDTIVSCSSGGVSIPPLTGTTPEGANQPNQGKAIVSSSDSSECSLLGVEARVYYTTGSDPPDTAISAISNSKIVFIDEGNLGD